MATLLLLSNSGGCRKHPDFDVNKLTYKGLFVYNDQLRVDGIYYLDEGGYYNLIYLYRDGTCFRVSTDYVDFDPSTARCYRINQGTRDRPYYWGCYVIEGNVLKIQMFDGIKKRREFTIEERWATIENDGTLHFFRWFRNRSTGPDEVALDETYRFQHCSNKPDSMNVLMNYY